MKSKYLINDKVKIKTDISDILKNHTQFKWQDNRGIEKYLGKKAIITYIVYDDDTLKPYYRYIIDIDDGDYWWVNECFEE